GDRKRAHVGCKAHGDLGKVRKLSEEVFVSGVLVLEKALGGLFQSVDFSVARIFSIAHAIAVVEDKTDRDWAGIFPEISDLLLDSIFQNLKAVSREPGYGRIVFARYRDRQDYR